MSAPARGAEIELTLLIVFVGCVIGVIMSLL
jgi:hypothetical protein